MGRSPRAPALRQDRLENGRRRLALGAGPCQPWGEARASDTRAEELSSKDAAARPPISASSAAVEGRANLAMSVAVSDRTAATDGGPRWVAGQGGRYGSAGRSWTGVEILPADPPVVDSQLPGQTILAPRRGPVPGGCPAAAAVRGGFGFGLNGGRRPAQRDRAVRSGPRPVRDVLCPAGPRGDARRVAPARPGQPHRTAGRPAPRRLRRAPAPDPRP